MKKLVALVAIALACYMAYELGKEQTIQALERAWAVCLPR